MKKLVCMALSAALLAGSVPAYAADYITKVPHTFTARVGTTEFTKDGTAQPLDVAIYTKNGYTMLPLRTFMNAVLQIHPKNMIWDGKKQTATVLYGAYILIFDLKNNTILKNGEALPVWGKMEVKDGRVFVPLRNWSGILQSIGYLIEEGDITWDSTTKLATVRAVEQKLDPSNGLEKPALSGKGAQASYAVALSTQYDEIEPLGDGYVMLPLRTFMQALDADAELVWEDGIQLAKVTMQDYTLSFDITGNRIWRNSSLLPSFGQMEVKDGRVFVPLRDWEGVLQGNSRYIVDADALRWDAETKTAAVQLTELTAATENDTSSIKGTGEAAVFGIPLTDRYDYIESIGGDYFIARKYLNQDSGKPNEDGNWDTDWFVLDHQGKVLHEYDNKDVSYLRGYGDGFLRLNKRDGTSQILDMEGNTQFADDYHVIDSFSEGLAMVMDYKEGKSGYINAKGEEVISLSSYSADAFSEGLAAVGVDLPKEEGMQSAETRYGYIDKKGGWVIEPKYRDAFAFRDGLAKVEDTDRNIGYIDKTGKEVIPLRYNKITDFWNGKAFAQEKSGEVILIDTTGKKLKSIITGKYLDDCGNGIISTEVSEQVAPGRVEYVKLYFDENGRISKEDARWRMRLSEGLAPYQDEKTGKYGYVGEDGTWVIAPTFDFARDFKDGYAVVSKKVTLANGKEDVQWGTVCHPI